MSMHTEQLLLLSRWTQWTLFPLYFQSTFLCLCYLKNLRNRFWNLFTNHKRSAIITDLHWLFQNKNFWHIMNHAYHQTSKHKTMSSEDNGNSICCSTNSIHGLQSKSCTPTAKGWRHGYQMEYRSWILGNIVDFGGKSVSYKGSTWQMYWFKQVPSLS